MLEAAIIKHLTKSTARRSSAVAALERLTRLAGQGVGPHRMAGAALDILADWRSDGIEPDELRARIETVASNIGAAWQAAEDCVAEADGEAGRAAARRRAEALRAVRDLLTVEAARF